MTPILLALAAFAAPQAAPAPASDQALSQRCLADVRADAEKAVATANDWRMRGGGWLARQCLGLAYSSLGRWEPAATAFDQAAAEAEVKRDPHHADLLVQGGKLRGEVLLDRARAGVMASDLPGARIDIDKALALVPADPFGWYLSAALARREGKLERAKTDIAKAVELGGDDAAVLLEAGNIAGVAGDVDAAKGLYARAIRAAPESEAAKSAQAALTANAAPQP
ncbi:MAG: hypothetical protein E6G94_15515 [Alphaproteobacteria bacterium]|nr:MAG: hypothetical protein E6G94_15515 [Alphaproteobacteria bacterium]